MTKQTTIVVIGSLRVKLYSLSIKFDNVADTNNPGSPSHILLGTEASVSRFVTIIKARDNFIMTHI